MATTAAKKTPAAKTPAAKTSTAVAVKKASSSSIVSIQEALKAQVASMSERTSPASGISIRTSGKEFILPDGTKTLGPLQLVIVDFVSRNEFYEGAYDPNAIAPPVCFAIGTNPQQLVPSENSPANQSPDGCGSCPMNVFGSAGNGKACKNTRVLAVLPPDADADTPLWLLKVSPTGLKGFDGYVSNVARTFQMPPVGVVTEVSLDPNQTYASLRFGDPQPNAELAAHFARQDEARELINREPDLTQRAAPAKPQGRAPARKTVAMRR